MVIVGIKRFGLEDTTFKMRLFLLSLCLALSSAQDTSVCTQQTPGANDPPLPPNLPDLFQMHVEANINNRNYTVEYHVFYDKKHNQVTAHIRNAGTRTEDFYRFDTNEYFHVDRDAGTCTVSPLNTAPYLYLFGELAGNTAVMKTPNQFLHFNEPGTSWKYINQTVIRGVTCNLWRSCVYWAATKSTMLVDWYFTAPSWTTSRLVSQLPLRAHVYGNTVDPNGKTRKFDHAYEFVDFNIDPKHRRFGAYQTPEGVYCPRAQNRKPLPTPTSTFHFKAEILYSNYISSIKEWYDSDLNLVKYDYDPLGDLTFGSKPLQQIHDFSTGVAYVIDKLRGNCTATAISNTGFDVRNSDPAHVRIRTSQEFFYFDKASYIYEGQREVRGIRSDVWIAQRNDWPSPNSPNSTWEWYFALPNYTMNNLGSLSFGNPVRMVLDAGIGQHYIYNIYDYNERRPVIWSYNIGQCFNYTERKDFSFKLPGSFRKLVSGNMELFRYACLRAIVKAGSVKNINLSALRVNNIQIDFADNNDIIVQFTLLDKAPQIGDVSNPKPENGLSVVAKAISGAIDNGQLIVMLDVPYTNTATIVAKQYSLTPGRTIKNAYYSQAVQGSVSSTGVSGGAMAGMGVALLVIFFIVGVAATYFYYRRHGGAFGPKKFDNEDITSSDT